MTTISAERLCATPVTSFRPDGSLVDLSRPEPCEVDFDEVAFGLAKIARFTGTHSGPPYSVAQHSVMGAEAIMREERDEMLAALFLLHDGHEYKLGDDSRPKQDLLAAMLEEFSPNSAAAYRQVMARAKAGWDNAIYGAAGLPAPNAWTKRQQQMIARMDIRMMAAEAEALFGSAARQVYPRAKHPEPLTRGAILPWGMAKAEERFLECFDSLIGIKQRHTAKNNHLMHRKTQR